MIGPSLFENWLGYVKNEKQGDLGKYFRAPGHVTLLKASEGNVLKRKGHTEMSIALMEMAGLTEVAVCCEMMDDENGESLNTEHAENYAKENNLIFLSGDEVIEAYKEFVSD